MTNTDVVLKTLDATNSCCDNCLSDVSAHSSINPTTLDRHLTSHLTSRRCVVFGSKLFSDHGRINFVSKFMHQLDKNRHVGRDNVISLERAQ